MFSQLAKTPVGYKRQSLGRLEMQDLWLFVANKHLVKLVK